MSDTTSNDHNTHDHSTHEEHTSHVEHTTTHDEHADHTDGDSGKNRVVNDSEEGSYTDVDLDPNDGETVGTA